MKRCITMKLFLNNVSTSLSSNSRFTSFETRVFGRFQAGERLSRLRLKDHMRVFQENKPVFIDAIV